MQTYQSMKDSEVVWLGDIPADWSIDSVKWVLNRKVLKNQSDDPVVLSLARAGVKVRDISTNEGQLAESYLNYNVVDPGDVLLNPMDLISGANCSVSKVSGVISPAYVNLHPIAGYDSRYFDYYFKLQYWSSAFFVHGKGVSYDNRWTLSADTLSNYPVLVPDATAQKRIADHLDEETAKIDNLIDKQERLLELLEEKRRATIAQSVTQGINNDIELKETSVSWLHKIPRNWSTEKIKYCTKRRDDKIVTANSEKYLGLEHVQSFTGKELVATAQSNPEGLTLAYKEGDVLFGKLRPYLAKVLITQENGICSSEFLVLASVTGKILPEYLFFSLLNEQFIQEVNSSTFGAKMPRANWDFIGNTYLPLPQLDEQKHIVDFLVKIQAKVNELKEEVQSQISLLKERRKSLISHAVTGKIKV